MLDAKAVPPGPKGLPVLGNVLQMGGQDILQFHIGLHHRFGDVVKMRLGPLDAYSFASPEAIHDILVTSHRQFEKGFGYSGLRLLLGEGLITTDNMPQWASQRQRLNPHFSPGAIAGYSGAVYDALIRAIDEFAPVAAAGGSIDVTDAMTRLTMRVISDAAFGVDLGAGHQDIADAINFTFGFVADITNNPLRPPLFVPTPRNLKYKRSLALIEAFIADLIRKARLSRNASSMSGKIFEALKDNDDRMLRDEVISLYFAGYETTARAMTFMMHLLAVHPDVRDRVRAEAEGFVRPGEAMDVVRHLPFTAEVVNETLRLYPPVAVMARQPLEDMEIAGYHVPAGSMVIVIPYLAQRHPAYWPDANRFAPDAERPLARRLTHRGAFTPFGSGPRVCLGKQFALVEMTIAIALLSQRFDWTTDGPAELPVAFGGTIRPRDRLTARLSAIPA